MSDLGHHHQSSQVHSLSHVGSNHQPQVRTWASRPICQLLYSDGTYLSVLCYSQHWFLACTVSAEQFGAKAHNGKLV